jgi:hypothetical protein
MLRPCCPPANSQRQQPNTRELIDLTGPFSLINYLLHWQAQCVLERISAIGHHWEGKAGPTAEGGTETRGPAPSPYKDPSTAPQKYTEGYYSALSAEAIASQAQFLALFGAYVFKSRSPCTNRKPFQLVAPSAASFEQYFLSSRHTNEVPGSFIR